MKVRDLAATNGKAFNYNLPSGIGNNGAATSSNVSRPSAPLPSLPLPSYLPIKNLEKDLETFRQLYEDELKVMRIEIEELAGLKNKLALDNFNLEHKLSDFIEK